MLTTAELPEKEFIMRISGSSQNHWESGKTRIKAEFLKVPITCCRNDLTRNSLRPPLSPRHYCEVIVISALAT